MEQTKTYNSDEVINRLKELVANLDNSIVPQSEGILGDNDMPKRLTEKVKVLGRDRWIHGYCVQELYDNYVKLLVQEGVVEMVDEDDEIPCFGAYLNTFYETFKQKQQSNTVVNRKRIIRNHIEPAFGNRRLDRIRTTDIQRWFNSLANTYSKETILKIKNIMSPVFDAAVEDEIIDRNPMASKRIGIGGKETVHHKAIPKEKMEYIRDHIVCHDLGYREKMMTALLSYTGMRFEEILGLQWGDIEFKNVRIIVRRAVVHPNRNIPEVKCPKTKTSEREIPINDRLFNILVGYDHGVDEDPDSFVLYSEKDKKKKTPLSYTEARRCFDRIRKFFDIQDYTAHDFRDTCATEWREKGMPLDVIARILGHSKTETTEKRYVKYRGEMMEKAREMM